MCSSDLFPSHDNMSRTKEVTQSDEAKQRRKKTCIEKYGTETPFQSNIIQSKIKLTIQEKNGVDNISSCDSVKDKRLTTFILKYGVNNSSKIPGVRGKAKHNYINSLGIDCTPEQANSITIGNLYRPISKELIEESSG